jgi:hypothetical protein
VDISGFVQAKIDSAANILKLGAYVFGATPGVGTTIALTKVD